VDWKFSFDASAGNGSAVQLTAEATALLSKVETLSKAIQKTQLTDTQVCAEFLDALSLTGELNLPLHVVEESSGLRGAAVEKLMAGRVSVPNFQLGRI
jgi:hypothetical protein